MSSELLNFCSAGLCSSITASSATSDGFEAENLLSSASGGFLAAGFVRPPVTITLQFCCAVSLRQIRLGLRLRQQHTTGLQLLVAAPGSDVWQPAGSLWERHGQPPPDDVSFVNRAATGGRSGSGPPPAALQLPLSCRDRLALRRVARLRVVISRARGPSALCLSGLRVWAVPAEPNHPALRAVLRERATRRTDIAAAAGSTSVTPTPVTAEPQPQSQPIGAEAVRAAMEHSGGPTPPEEFIDPITCELMLLPMVLPSGHTVDQTTLERHERAEAGWGRPPGDPFSGVPFGGAARPVPDAALKARIDHFLFEHAGAAPELAALGRTLGRAKRPAPPAPEISPPAQRPAYDPRASEPGRAASGDRPAAAAAGDLDAALRAALTGLKSFQPRPVPAAPACGCGASQGLYALPCSHATCRACLLCLPKAAECAICRKTFQKADVVRLHT